MDKLGADEIDILNLIKKKTDLQPYFFKKAKRLKWFNALAECGYFNPEKIPKPLPAQEEGYVIISYWPAIEYLVKASEVLHLTGNQGYALKFLDILRDVTKYAVDHDISNYKTWSQFAEIIPKIPSGIIKLEDIKIVEHWLDDKYERSLVAKKIGEKWTLQLLESNDEHSLQLALGLLSSLFKVVFGERKLGETVKCESSFRFESYYAQEISEKIARLAGIKLGKEAVLIFDKQLKIILEKLNKDSWSDIWQPAIEKHEQNQYSEDAENILVYSYRNSLSGYITTKPVDACEYIKEMLDEKYQTINRLAIHAISTNFNLCENLIDLLLDIKYFDSNYTHEMWHFLNKNYKQFSEVQKLKILGLISNITRTDDDGKLRDGTTAYNKATWLAAIQEYGEKEKKLYDENVKIAKTEPDHPDFSSYLSTGWGVHESPIPIEELQALSIEELVDRLKNYTDSGGFREPGIEGLVNAFKQIIKASPLRYFNQLNKFVGLDLAYICEITETYRDLWAEKAQLPWDDIWACLLDFCLLVINQDSFWNPENEKKRKPFVASRGWIVSSIGQLLIAGTQSDDHVFSEKYLKKAENIIVALLEKEKGRKYQVDGDAVSISIKSPRGKCLQALINLSLRSCRLSDKNNNKNHSEVWASFKPRYDAELKRADIQNPEYEFATLITDYLPNFLYMSKEWVLENLDKIFDQEHYLKWFCAMQGYVYVGTVSREIYQYLKEHGDFIRVLGDENFKDQVKKKVIQNIAVAYISDFEKYSDEDSLISVLISRKNHEELSHLVWSIWSLQKKGVQDLQNKVYALWPEILKNVDLSTREGKKMASQLCRWAIFVDKIDDERRELLLKIVPYANEAYNSYELLKNIADISQAQPFEAHEIWMKMLEGPDSGYPEEAVRQIFTNLVKNGPEGIRKAKEAASKYLKKGNDLPSIWLKEIMQEPV